MVDVKLSQQNFWNYYDNMLIKAIRTYVYISSPINFIVALGLSSFIVIHSKEKQTWNTWMFARVS